MSFQSIILLVVVAITILVIGAVSIALSPKPIYIGNLIIQSIKLLTIIALFICMLPVIAIGFLSSLVAAGWMRGCEAYDSLTDILKL